MTIHNCLYTFFCSMIPVIELRGAIPLGYGLGLPWALNYALCVIGNFLPVPFILLFIRAILSWMKKVPKLSGIANKIEEIAHKKSVKVLKYASVGLFVFVAIPLPGTGAWTGALIAALLDMRFKYSLPSIFAGVITAGLIMTGICYGFLDFLRFLLF
ncbi:MAG: small multi-drug export protein [Firmicutes bacterium]|nr:small multi-drug export protein [Bacillota bacterium]